MPKNEVNQSTFPTGDFAPSSASQSESADQEASPVQQEEAAPPAPPTVATAAAEESPGPMLMEFDNEADLLLSRLAINNAKEIATIADKAIERGQGNYILMVSVNADGKARFTLGGLGTLSPIPQPAPEGEEAQSE